MRHSDNSNARTSSRSPHRIVVFWLIGVVAVMTLLLINRSLVSAIGSDADALHGIPRNPHEYHLRGDASLVADGNSNSNGGMSALPVSTYLQNFELLSQVDSAATAAVTTATATAETQRIPPPPQATVPDPKLEIPSSPAPAKTYSSIIFVKTYKTASTTVAMILNSIAFKLRLNCLHPTKDGWFKENELKDRARLGHRFDVSFRHMTPVLELEPLQELLPDSLITTIMRDPITKFNSMFNFVQTTRAHYGTAMNFVNAVKEGKASAKEKNDLCNNLAYSMSGSQTSLADLNYQESKDYAEKMIADFESKDVFVMIMERMNESLVVMCERMGWDCYSGALSFKNTVERQNKQAGTVKCNDEECKKGIKSVNEVDWMLYEYYKEKLDAIIKTIPDFETKLKKLGENMEKSAANAQKYPVNCFERVNPDRPEFEAIHTCQGRM